ncbi:MAG TPA: hypothetical protein VFV34_23795, partial [Blastocatellia bacterium]|nr:hypothetical protein [Blastocatellia bacterium]
ILFCDFDLDANNPQHTLELDNYLDDIRLLLIEVLGEEDVWIVYNSVTRVAGQRQESSRISSGLLGRLRRMGTQPTDVA